MSQIKYGSIRYAAGLEIWAKSTIVIITSTINSRSQTNEKKYNSNVKNNIGQKKLMASWTI